MCKRLTVIILILGVLFAPAVAYADDGFEGSGGDDFSDRVITGPNVLDIQGGTYGVQVYAGNKFNAALCVLGFDGYDSRFTNDVKAYLSNESTGGSFYEFSNLFTNNNSTSFTGLGVGNITFDSSIEMNNLLYGAEFVWIAKYTDTLRQAAYARVEEVLDGNISGGSGSGSGSGALPNVINLSNHYHYSSYFMKNWPTGSDWDDINPKITINDNAMQQLSEYLSNYPNVYGYWRSTSDIYYNRSYNAYLIMTDGNVTVSDSGDTKHLVINGNGIKVTFSGNATIDTNFDSIGNIANLTNTDKTVEAYCIWWSDLVTGSPVVPPTQWPEPDPVTPTEPPVVPEPPSSDPVSDPTDVNIGIPQLPNIGLTTEPTYETADLSAVLDAMAKHCQHLQSCMIECFDSYYSSITQFEKSLQENSKDFFRSWFRVLMDNVNNRFEHMEDYLHTLFTWLASQMDFTFTGGDYDDSSIVWWLKQIYSKLGSGTTVRPTDPVVDPTGIGDWFDQLLKNFIAALLGFGQDALSDVGDMVEDLTTKFPFSIPWDIAALLALFAASPQVPVFEIPQYALTGNGVSQVGTYTIDLTPYDGVMDIARSIEKVVFAFWLAWKIDFFKAILNGIVGGDK